MKSGMSSGDRRLTENRLSIGNKSCDHREHGVHLNYQLATKAVINSIQIRYPINTNKRLILFWNHSCLLHNTCLTNSRNIKVKKWAHSTSKRELTAHCGAGVYYYNCTITTTTTTNTTTITTTTTTTATKGTYQQ